VLAVVANARLFYETDVSGCQEVAKRSVRINPSSPLAWDSLSNARLLQRAGLVDAKRVAGLDR
jgi:hypothetical protein